ncbi:MAG TPA: hypothetical protein VJ922_00500 [Actinomycetota bacterium]|nr:hypothetical protein [Actinomycetota bacterium]
MSGALALTSRDLSELVRVHRMAAPVVRRRVVAIAALLIGLGWALVSLVGNPGGVYSTDELRHLGGIPFAPPQIQQRIAPPLGSNDFNTLITQLEQIYSGGAQPSPTPGSTR